MRLYATGPVCVFPGPKHHFRVGQRLPRPQLRSYDESTNPEEKPEKTHSGDSVLLRWYADVLSLMNENARMKWIVIGMFDLLRLCRRVVARFLYVAKLLLTVGNYLVASFLFLAMLLRIVGDYVDAYDHIVSLVNGSSELGKFAGKMLILLGGSELGKFARKMLILLGRYKR